MIALDPGSHVCGCLPSLQCHQLPVIWSRNNNKKNINLKQRIILLVNAGNANAFTGEEGLLACQKKATALSSYLIVTKKHFLCINWGYRGTTPL